VRLACLDTHALVWHLSKPARLGRAAARLLRDADAGRTAVLIPAIVAVELSLLRQAGRNTIGVPQLEAVLAAQPAFTLLPLDLAQAREFALLESLRDPFDRMGCGGSTRGRSAARHRRHGDPRLRARGCRLGLNLHRRASATASCAGSDA